MVSEIGTHLIAAAVRRSNDIRRFSTPEPELRGERVAVRVERKDLFVFQLYTFFRRNLMIRLLLAALILLGLLVLPADIGTALVFFGLALFVAAWGFMLALLVGARRPEEPAQVYGFAAGGLYFMRKGETRRVSWERLLLRGTPGHYYLYYSPFAAFVLPRGELTAAGRETVRHYAAAYELHRRPFRRRREK